MSSQEYPTVTVEPRTCLRLSRALLRAACYNIVPTRVGKMRAELAGQNLCAVPFLSRAAAN